jgi:peptidoglycan hydrolase-like protein with peptidoglycan-binding domain
VGRALAAALCLFAVAGADAAHAQVAGRQLLSWCEGALGGSATATFDAFRCEAYLQSVIDRETADGTDFSACLGSARPAAGDLMARIVPQLRRAAAESPGSLARPAQEVVGGWIAEACGEASPDSPVPPQPIAAAPPPDAGPDPQIELAVWQATQRLERPAARIRALEHYLETFPGGRFADLARLQLEELRAVEREAAAPPAEPAEAAPPRAEAPPEPPEPEPAPQPQREASPEPPAPDTADAAPPEPTREAAPEPRRFEDGLSAAERRDIQRALRDLDLYGRGIDGIFGRGTRQAIRGFQSAAGRPQTGYLTRAEAEMLLGLAEEADKPAEPGGARGTGARGTDASVTVRNAGNSAIVAIYASPANADDWAANRLGDTILLPGTELRVALNRSGTCRYDLRVVDERNRSREYWSLDACRHTRLSFAD